MTTNSEASGLTDFELNAVMADVFSSSRPSKKFRSLMRAAIAADRAKRPPSTSARRLQDWPMADLLLHVGEMTAQEKRTVRSVLAYIDTTAPSTSARPITALPVFAIIFDDRDRQHEIISGEDVARARFEQVGASWNAHLFVKVKSNSRDDPFHGSNCVVEITPSTSAEAVAISPYRADLLRMGKAMAKERAREIGDAWNQLADLLHHLSLTRVGHPTVVLPKPADGFKWAIVVDHDAGRPAPSTSAEAVAIDYSAVYRIADEMGVSYNALSSAVRAAVHPATSPSDEAVGVFKPCNEGRWIDDETHDADVILRIDGNWESDQQRKDYAQSICDRLNGEFHPAPSPTVAAGEATGRFVPSGACTCAGPDGPCEGCLANREAYEEWLAERAAPTDPKADLLRRMAEVLDEVRGLVETDTCLHETLCDRIDALLKEARQ